MKKKISKFCQGGNMGDLKDVKTNWIIPVDLNSIMFMNYNCVSEFYAVLVSML
jgi:Trehalase